MIAAAAAGMPQALLPVPEEDDGLEGAHRLRPQPSFTQKQATQRGNRVRAALVETNGALERLVNLDRAWSLDLIELVGGPWQLLEARFARLEEVAAVRARDGGPGAVWESLSRAT